MDEDHAQLQGRLHGVRANHIPSDAHHAAVRLMDAGQDAAESRFPSAVLTDEPQDLACPEAEVRRGPGPP